MRISQAKGLLSDKTLESESTEGATCPKRRGISQVMVQSRQAAYFIVAYCRLCFLFAKKAATWRQGALPLKNGHDFLIITNNPLVERCLGEYYSVEMFEEASYRDILVKVRDLVYASHTLYTHPLSGSVKPNETPYKSVVVSKVPHTFDPGEAEIIAYCIEAFDKFKPRGITLTDPVKRDFQLIDYTLICGAVDFDAAAGLSKIK